jgi:hypothetical protein
VNRADLVAALASSKVSEWALTARDQELAIVASGLRRRELRTRWTLVVHHDVSNGRGSARLDITGEGNRPAEVVAQALALANASIGPPWKTLPPAAPASVELHDRAFDLPDFTDAAAGVVRGRVEVAATVLRETVSVETRHGLRTTWTATHVRADATIARGDHSLELSREARRLADLDLDDAIELARADLELRGQAGAPVAGPCALFVGPDALLHGGGYGMWAVFAAQADAIVERQGLTRYHEGMPVAPGADTVPEPLAIDSDGALAFGTQSAPVAEDGDAVRRFPLVARGIAAGLGLSPREAAFRQRDPNGGVRDLVVALGSLGAPGDQIVEVRRLRSLAIDPYTGDASFEIALGIDHRTGVPFAGGTVRLDLVAALARAKRSATPLRRGAYSGPAAVLFEDAEVI